MRLRTGSFETRIETTAGGLVRGPRPWSALSDAARGHGGWLGWTARGRAGTVLGMEASVDFTLAFEDPDEAGWIVARVLEVPGAISQGRTREEARENVLDALRTVLTPDDELSGEQPRADLEHLRFVTAA